MVGGSSALHSHRSKGHGISSLIRSRADQCAPYSSRAHVFQCERHGLIDGHLRAFGGQAHELGLAQLFAQRGYCPLAVSARGRSDPTADALAQAFARALQQRAALGMLVQCSRASQSGRLDQSDTGPMVLNPGDFELWIAGIGQVACSNIQPSPRGHRVFGKYLNLGQRRCSTPGGQVLTKFGVRLKALLISPKDANVSSEV